MHLQHNSQKTHFMYLSHYLLAMLKNSNYSIEYDFDIIYPVYIFFKWINFAFKCKTNRILLHDTKISNS